MTLHSLLFLAAANEGDRWQQEQEESLLPHLLQKKKTLQERIYCKEGYLSLFLGEELKMIKVFGHLCSRNHQLGSLFAVGAPETMSRVKCIETYN